MPETPQSVVTVEDAREQERDPRGPPAGAVLQPGERALRRQLPGEESGDRDHGEEFCEERKPGEESRPEPVRAGSRFLGAPMEEEARDDEEKQRRIGLDVAPRQYGHGRDRHDESRRQAPGRAKEPSGEDEGRDDQSQARCDREQPPRQDRDARQPEDGMQ